MSTGSSSYDAFMSLPRRVFLDSSVLNNIHKYGDVLFEDQQLAAEAHIRKWEQGPEEISALRNILVVGRRADFRLSRWGHVQKVRPGDYLLCYLSRVSCWVGILEAQSNAYLDNTTRIWRTEIYPCRLDVRLLQSLAIEKAVPIRELADMLSIFKRPRWNFYLMGSPTKWKEEDARAVIEAIKQRAVVSQ